MRNTKTIKTFYKININAPTSLSLKLLLQQIIFFFNYLLFIGTNTAVEDVSVDDNLTLVEKTAVEIEIEKTPEETIGLTYETFSMTIYSVIEY
jgi:hypothetical protein